MVTREVSDRKLLSKYAKFRRIAKPESSPLCPEHHEAVTVQGEDTGRGAAGVSPPPILIFQGCCDAAIDRKFQFIGETLQANSNSSL
jgi:hypothetical protein